MELTKTHKIALLVTLLGGFFLIYFLFNPTEGLFFPSCPINFFTGLFCPGCGSQRALHLLFHGDLWGAFRFNPLMILSIPILVYGLTVTVLNYILKTSYRVPLFYNKLFIFGYFGIAILYGILRNLPWHPFNLLAPTG